MRAPRSSTRTTKPSLTSARQASWRGRRRVLTEIQVLPSFVGRHEIRRRNRDAVDFEQPRCERAIPIEPPDSAGIAEIGDQERAVLVQRDAVGTQLESVRARARRAACRRRARPRRHRASRGRTRRRRACRARIRADGGRAHRLERRWTARARLNSHVYDDRSRQMLLHSMHLGVVADDVTGATDLASVLRRDGWSVIQTFGIPESAPPQADVVIVSLKTRTAPVHEATTAAQAAASYLTNAGATQIYFKYCSTFDSTEGGNIGPVIESLLPSCAAPSRSPVPRIPGCAARVYLGHLFVGEQLLSESSMRHHPLTPMTDANLVRVLGRQSPIPVGLVPLDGGGRGRRRHAERFAALERGGHKVAIVDAVLDRHLDAIACACRDFRLVTGGAAFGGALARRRDNRAHSGRPGRLRPCDPDRSRCSAEAARPRRLEQVRRLPPIVPHRRVDPLALAPMTAPPCGADGLGLRAGAAGHVLMYSTTTPEAMRNAQRELGRGEAAALLEHAFGALALALAVHGVRGFIVAGGETSGAVLEALGMKMIGFGEEIDPGVPWTCSLDPEGFHFALKSGNFGSAGIFFQGAADRRHDRGRRTRSDGAAWPVAVRSRIQLRHIGKSQRAPRRAGGYLMSPTNVSLGQSRSRAASARSMRTARMSTVRHRPRRRGCISRCTRAGRGRRSRPPAFDLRHGAVVPDRSSRRRRAACDYALRRDESRAGRARAVCHGPGINAAAGARFRRWRSRIARSSWRTTVRSCPDRVSTPPSLPPKSWRKRRNCSSFLATGRIGCWMRSRSTSCVACSDRERSGHGPAERRASRRVRGRRVLQPVPLRCLAARVRRRARGRVRSRSGARRGRRPEVRVPRSLHRRGGDARRERPDFIDIITPADIPMSA